MGMAASQARYLALSARKTNTEYEGQQLNQQRLNLSNQSADLFNQMLTMSVPVCPDSNDFTTLQYSWSDGINDSVISNYYQLGTPQEDYNYVVTSYHFENVYTGQKKVLNDPQIQAKKTNHFTKNDDVKYNVTQLTYDHDKDQYSLTLEKDGGIYHKTFVPVDKAQLDTLEELDALSIASTGEMTKVMANGSANVLTPVDNTAGATAPAYYTFAQAFDVRIPNPAFNPALLESDTNQRYINQTIPVTAQFTQVDDVKVEDTAGAIVTVPGVATTDGTAITDVIAQLKETYGAEYDAEKTYFAYKIAGESGTTPATYAFICAEDMEAARQNQGDAATVPVRAQNTIKYYTDGTNYVTADELSRINLNVATPVSDILLKSAENNPTFSDYQAVGNCKLTEIDEDMYKEDATIGTALEQIMKDINAENGSPISAERLRKCFDENGNYISGSLFKFTMNGKTYYTTPEDLDDSLISATRKDATAENTIDSQHQKLSYYDAVYLKQKVEETKKALLETDGKGRFSSVKFEDDSVVYTLNCETITDEAAYQDAMNKYYYKQEQYDKQVADINAKTEIIQAEDRELQLRLEQLGTEQTALQTEMEACQKVVSKNVESSFKTFGG